MQDSTGHATKASRVVRTPFHETPPILSASRITTSSVNRVPLRRHDARVPEDLLKRGAEQDVEVVTVVQHVSGLHPCSPP